MSAQKQTEIDVKNLNFYADMFEQHNWSTVVIHHSVFAHTLREISERLAELEAENAEPRKDKERLDKLELWLVENQYNHDLALCSDEEDGVWFARFVRWNQGATQGQALSGDDTRPETVRSAIDAMEHE